MSIESARDFVERVASDNEFGEKLAVAESRKNRAEIAKSEGNHCGFTHESEHDV